MNLHSQWGSTQSKAGEASHRFWRHEKLNSASSQCTNPNLVWIQSRNTPLVTIQALLPGSVVWVGLEMFRILYHHLKAGKPYLLRFWVVGSGIFRVIFLFVFNIGVCFLKILNTILYVYFSMKIITLQHKCGSAKGIQVSKYIRSLHVEKYICALSMEAHVEFF